MATKAENLRAASIISDQIADHGRIIARHRKSIAATKVEAVKKLHRGWIAEEQEKMAELRKWLRYHRAEAKKAKS